MIFKKIIAWLKKKYSDCFFVGASDILPPPLSKEEELAYLICGWSCFLRKNSIQLDVI